jgi:hypothetical protein
MAGAAYGFVTVAAPQIKSDLYVALSDGDTYTATHGRHEFVEHYPWWNRAVLAVAGVPDRIGAVALNNFESYLFSIARRPGGTLSPSATSHASLRWTSR